MKKHGFTLAEVLVSLAIVGVVAALTIPSLTANTANAKIGPTLAKATAAFEQANQAMLNDLGVDSLTDAGFAGNEYIDNLKKRLKIIEVATYNDSSRDIIYTKDGVSYDIPKGFSESGAGPNYNQMVAESLIIDINGDSGANTAASDQFYFSWWNDGSLRPKGATNWNGEDSSKDGGSEHWKTKCAIDSIPSDDKYCAGHIFENNLKVLYK